MTAVKEYKNRHKETSKTLSDVAKEKISLYGVVRCSEKIASILSVSPQTVRNYLEGRGRDGFLVEAMIKEFKDLVI